MVSTFLKTIGAGIRSVVNLPISQPHETISHQKARSSVSCLGWVMIQRGKEWPSLDGNWNVYKVGEGFYRRRPISPY